MAARPGRKQKSRIRCFRRRIPGSTSTGRGTEKRWCIQSRCTDDQGEVQPTLAEMNRNWGRSENDRLEPTNQTFHWNAIQPWKIARDGSITDALFA